MKTRYFLVTLFVALGCSTRHDATLPLIDPPGQQWATFEGSIVSDEQEVIEVELRLRESSTGLPSDYRLNGIVVTDNYTSGWTSAGLYEAVPLDSGRFGIHIMGLKSGHEASSDAFFTRNIDRMRNVPSKPNNYLSADFYFTTTGDGRLTQSDDHFHVAINGTRSTIYKRSNLFTIEGYVTVEPDSAMKFFERNTFENWQVAHLGVYGVLKEKYKHLASEPWEGIYVRALAYSVTDSTNEASQHGALVVKKLIAMGESPK
jgi:hypothetical protein